MLCRDTKLITTVHSMNSSPQEIIKRVSFPLNQFKNQIEILKSDHNSLRSTTIFPNFQNHKIKFTTRSDLINNLKLVVSEKHLNAIYSSEETFYFIKDSISNSFLSSKFVFTTIKLKNITDLDEKLHIINEIHNRAHRHAINNYDDAIKTFYWPGMRNDFIKFEM